MSKNKIVVIDLWNREGFPLLVEKTDETKIADFIEKIHEEFDPHNFRDCEELYNWLKELAKKNGLTPVEFERW